jgi:hypothetical protein
MARHLKPPIGMNPIHYVDKKINKKIKNEDIKRRVDEGKS